MIVNDYNMGEIDSVGLQNGQHITTIDHLKALNTSHKGGIFAMAMVDTETLITGSSDRSLKVWKMQPEFTMV